MLVSLLLGLPSRTPPPPYNMHSSLRFALLHAQPGAICSAYPGRVRLHRDGGDASHVPLESIGSVQEGCRRRQVNLPQYGKQTIPPPFTAQCFFFVRVHTLQVWGKPRWDTDAANCSTCVALPTNAQKTPDADGGTTSASVVFLQGVLFFCSSSERSDRAEDLRGGSVLLSALP